MSGYLFEETDPERFQQLVQSLLLKDYPRLQCFPVAQSDGGRDGQVRGDDLKGDTIVQVKFKRRDEPSEDIAAWMISSLEGELPKIERLIENGASEYVMVTNARGTAHLGGGSIDRVQAWLDANISVRSQCLWRDDLDRRLEANPSILWRYPEVLTGAQGIKIAMDTMLTASKERQSRAINAFLGAQYDRDSTVRFKQVDLKNDLLSLFIDVRAVPSERIRRNAKGSDSSTFRLFQDVDLFRTDTYEALKRRTSKTAGFCSVPRASERQHCF